MANFLTCGHLNIRYGYTWKSSVDALWYGAGYFTRQGYGPFTAHYDLVKVMLRKETSTLEYMKLDKKWVND